MPSSEDVIAARNNVKKIAVEIVIKQQNCSRNFAQNYVHHLSDEELENLTKI